MWTWLHRWVGSARTRLTNTSTVGMLCHSASKGSSWSGQSHGGSSSQASPKSCWMLHMDFPAGCPGYASIDDIYMLWIPHGLVQGWLDLCAQGVAAPVGCEGESGTLRFHFAYQEIKDGLHPCLQRHAAVWKLDHPADLQEKQRIAWSTKKQYTRKEWEIDTVMSAVILAVMARCNVAVAGLKTPLASLRNIMLTKHGANNHLVDTVLAHWSCLSLVELEPKVHSELVGALKKHQWRAPEQYRPVLDTNYDMAIRLNEVIVETFSLYPGAHSISRFHGHRGGIHFRAMMILLCEAPTLCVSDSLSMDGTFVCGGGGGSSGGSSLYCLCPPLATFILQLLMPCVANVTQPA